MNGPNDSTAPERPRGWRASPPRSGMQRMIFPWEYRHLPAFACVQAAAHLQQALTIYQRIGAPPRGASSKPSRITG